MLVEYSSNSQTNIVCRGGFNCHKWNENSPNVSRLFAGIVVLQDFSYFRGIRSSWNLCQTLSRTFFDHLSLIHKFFTKNMEWNWTFIELFTSYIRYFTRFSVQKIPLFFLGPLHWMSIIKSAEIWNVYEIKVCRDFEIFYNWILFTNCWLTNRTYLAVFRRW